MWLRLIRYEPGLSEAPRSKVLAERLGPGGVNLEVRTGQVRTSINHQVVCHVTAPLVPNYEALGQDTHPEKKDLFEYPRLLAVN